MHLMVDNDATRKHPEVKTWLKSTRALMGDKALGCAKYVSRCAATPEGVIRQAWFYF